MSLINKMLRDLESRDRASSKPAAKLTFEDLRAVDYKRKRSSSLRPTLVLVSLVAVAIAAGAYYALRRPTGPDQVALAKIPAPAATPVIAAADDVLPAQKPTVSEPPAPAVTGAVDTPSPVNAPVALPAPRPTTTAPRAVEKPPISATRRTQDAPASGTADADKTIIEKHDRPATAQERADAHYRQAAQQVSQGRNEQARATLATALSIFPEHHKARELAAAAALQGGHVREAQELLLRGMELAPQQSTFPRLLARIQLEQGLEAQAIATLEGVRSAALGDTDYLSLLAALYQRAGRHTDAVKTYRETIALRPQDARAWLGLGISLEVTQDAAAAEAAYNRALQVGGLDANLARYASQRLAALKR